VSRSNPRSSEARRGARRSAEGDPSPFDLGRRLVGLLLVALVAAPAFLILDPDDFVQGLMRSTGARQYGVTWGGGAIAVLAASLVAFGTRGRAQAGFARLGGWLARPSRTAWAVAVGLLGAGLTVAVALVFFDGRTILNDASVQLVQARYFAAGRLSGPVLPHPEFWTIQFMVLTAAGWVAQYPPMHALVLAGGLLVGPPWVAMAAVVFVVCAATSACFERLLPDRCGIARGAALATALSPLLLGLAAGYMSHATVAAFAALALYSALRAEEGSAVWALAAGAAMGAAVCTRPVTGLAIGAAVTLGVWGSSEKRARPWLLRRVGAWVLGGLPFAMAFGWFNDRFFGSPTTLGYVAASGPSQGLGFHTDPWGRAYGFTQALGNTSAELITLGRELLGTPFPVVSAVGLFLLLARRLTRGERILVAWALLPVLASALYWHHDLVFGPRMLGEAVPAWCALAILAAVALTRRGGGAHISETVAVAALLVSAAGLAWGGWTRIELHAARVGRDPEAGSEGPSLVFVHEPWSDRVGARLSARGMRLDSVRMLLTRYHPCQLEAAFRGRPVEEVGDICRRELASDSLGAFGITGMLWRGDLPGLAVRGPMWVRDLGPAANRRLIADHPERAARFLLPERDRRAWRIVSYDEGVRTLWGPPGETAPGGEDSAGGS